MKIETAMNAMASISESIRFYQEEIIKLLESKSEIELRNGIYPLEVQADYNDKLEIYELIIADLLTVRRAISDHKTSVKTFGVSNKNDTIFGVISMTLEYAGIAIDTNGFELLLLTPSTEEPPANVIVGKTDETELEQPAAPQTKNLIINLMQRIKHAV